MSVRIAYNSYPDIFSGLAPTPLIAKTIEYINYGERWAQIDQLTLNGNLTGKCIEFSDYVAMQSGLVRRFNKDFQTFQVIENNQEVYSCQFASIKAINFPESKVVGMVPFTIEVQCYPQAVFSGFFGVLDPQEEVSYNEKEDGSVELTHTTSARGFNTSSNQSNAFGNAKSFVSARTGWNSNFLPYFISYAAGINPVLKTMEEVPDRFNGTYSITETYISDTVTNDNGFLRYSVQTNSGIQGGPITVSLDGELQGGLNTTLSAIRTRFGATNFYSLASAVYAGTYSTSAGNLNTTPNTKKVTENTLNNTLSFSLEYDDDPNGDVFCDYTTRFEEDKITFNVKSTIEGQVRGKGERAARWTRVQNHYKDQVKDNLYGLLSSDYDDQKFKYSLNPNPISISESRDSFAAEIGFSRTYDSLPIPPTNLEYFKYSVSIKPAINKYAEEPLLEISEYYVQNLEFLSREVLSIQGQAKIKNAVSVGDGLNTIRTLVNRLIFTYSRDRRRQIIEQNYTKGNAQMERFVSFSVSVAYESSEFSV